VAAAVAREEHDPLGHLRQGLQWQAEADQRSAEAAIHARLAKLDALSIANRFRATNPPADAIKKFTALLEKLIEAVRANPGHPGHPQSRWEQEALQELRRFAGEAPVEQSHAPERPTQAALPPVATPPPLHRGGEEARRAVLLPVEPVAAAPFHKNSSEAPSKRSPTAMTASEAGRMGGTEAQKRRQEAGELAWTADALRIAKDARVEDPHIFTKTICERIWSKCRFKGCPAPDEEGNPSRQLYRFIERHEAIEDGIPKRAPYKEKKAVRRRAR
jgi:hypothetical protein